MTHRCQFTGTSVKKKLATSFCGSLSQKVSAVGDTLAGTQQSWALGLQWGEG